MSYSHSYLVLTILDRAGSAVAALFWPAHSIWLAPLWTGNATADKDRVYQKTAKDTHTHTHSYKRRCTSLSVALTRLPRIWLMAALSFRVHSATTLALISFIYSMKAFRGFLIWGFLSSSFLGGTGDFLLIQNIKKMLLMKREWWRGAGKRQQTRRPQKQVLMTIWVVLTHASRGWCCHRWAPAWWLGRRWRDGECQSGAGCAEVESPCEGRNGWTPSWGGERRQRFNSPVSQQISLNLVRKGWVSLAHLRPGLSLRAKPTVPTASV